MSVVSPDKQLCITDYISVGGLMRSLSMAILVTVLIIERVAVVSSLEVIVLTGQ